ncbi:MAG: hypothetical protein S4CHLAM37_04280 [Chlamydiia bacterium]|nr:hypothetical protein [Chlamydiia bacterium]
MSEPLPSYTQAQKEVIKKYIAAAQNGVQDDLESTLAPSVKAEWIINDEEPDVVEGRDSLINRIVQLLANTHVISSDTTFKDGTLSLEQKIHTNEGLILSDAKVTFGFEGLKIARINSIDTMTIFAQEG